MTDIKENNVGQNMTFIIEVDEKVLKALSILGIEYIIVGGQCRKSLSRKAQNIYNFYRLNSDITYKEAEKLLGINQSAIYQHIVKLEKYGYLKRDSRGGIIVL